jgi:hypothetical protein
MPEYSLIYDASDMIENDLYEMLLKEPLWLIDNFGIRGGRLFLKKSEPTYQEMCDKIQYCVEKHNIHCIEGDNSWKKALYLPVFKQATIEAYKMIDKKR